MGLILVLRLRDRTEIDLARLGIFRGKDLIGASDIPDGGQIHAEIRRRRDGKRLAGNRERQMIHNSLALIAEPDGAVRNPFDSHVAQIADTVAEELHEPF